MPFYRILGNLDAWDFRGRTNFLSRLNAKFYDYAASHNSFYINDEENAIAGLNHPEGTLRPKDMIVITANWQPKDMNFAEIAEEINILPESMAFVDDNPAERAKLQKSFASYEDYLISLEMKAQIKPFEPVYLPRITQLTNKSNQLNLTTKRYTETEIEAVSKDGSYVTLYGRLSDKLGDNDAISIIIGHKKWRYTGYRPVADELSRAETKHGARNAGRTGAGGA